MTTGAPLKLYNSLTRQLETFQPIDPAQVRVYTCGPTVYNYQHIGNMRAFLFADTLGRVLRWKGYNLKHIINITDVGHLTSDADAGDDKMEKAAAAQAKSIWEIAAHYTEAFKADIARLNITPPAEWTVATDHIPQMIEFAKAIEQDCYQIEGGLYFDTSKVPNYGSLARAATDEGESRIDPVSGKRNPADFAIWRKSPPGEQRQMEWDSPWGKGAPGWHLECSVMSLQHLGHPFDIHTGGIDHREIHHPNEIAQNQAFCACDDTGARIWMHNNFLIDRGGKMSKSTGEFLKLQVLIDRGVHPLAYRLMCLQAHYRSELEFTWESLFAALTRLKRLVQAAEDIRAQAPTKDYPGKGDYTDPSEDFWSARNARERESPGQRLYDDNIQYQARAHLVLAMTKDLDTPSALTALGPLLMKGGDADMKLSVIAEFDAVLGLNLTTLTRADLRLRPASATIDEATIEARLADRKAARAEKDFARSDTIRDELTAAGVEVMDGDPLGWDWRLS
jgi:cysteinyl-tRNA synthetase